MFAVGAGVGYVLGTRAGRERYEAMKTQADNLWHDPRVQDKVAEAGQAVKEKAPEVQAKLASAAGTVKDNVTETVKEKVADVKGADKPADAKKTDGAKPNGFTSASDAGVHFTDHDGVIARRMARAHVAFD